MENNTEKTEKYCQCSFAMIRRDQETQIAYCFECKKEIDERPEGKTEKQEDNTNSPIL
jgi:hypothetical protein